LGSGFAVSEERKLSEFAGESLVAFLVDDDPYSARFLTGRLANWDGLEIKWFPTTDEALDGLAAAARSESTYRPDLVIVDLKRNYSSNEEFALSAAPFVRDLGVPLVVLAGRPDEELVYTLTTAGVTAVLDRGARTEEIESELRRILGGLTKGSE